MLWVWSFLWGILILSWNNNPGICPTVPWPNYPGCSNWAFRLFCARTPATPAGGHTISRRRPRCLPAVSDGQVSVWIRDLTWLWCWRKTDHNWPHAIYIYTYICVTCCHQYSRKLIIIFSEMIYNTVLPHPTTTPLCLSPLLRPHPICSVLNGQKWWWGRGWTARTRGLDMLSLRITHHSILLSHAICPLWKEQRWINNSRVIQDLLQWRLIKLNVTVRNTEFHRSSYSSRPTHISGCFKATAVVPCTTTSA